MAALAEAGRSLDILDLALAAPIALQEDDLLASWQQNDALFQAAAIDAWDMDSLTLVPGTPPI